jgi:hypothetical protein
VRQPADQLTANVSSSRYSILILIVKLKEERNLQNIEKKFCNLSHTPSDCHHLIKNLSSILVVLLQNSFLKMEENHAEKQKIKHTKNNNKAIVNYLISPPWQSLC